MMRSTPFLQGCVGISFILLSFGGMWGMLSGAVVRGRIAGANFSVNDKLEAVEEARELISDSVKQLNSEPTVSKYKIRHIEKMLEEAEEKQDLTEQNISEDLSDMLYENELY